MGLCEPDPGSISNGEIDRPNFEPTFDVARALVGNEYSRPTTI